IVDVAKHAAAREGLQHAEIERRRANAAARERDAEEPRSPSRLRGIAGERRSAAEIAAFGVEPRAARGDERKLVPQHVVKLERRLLVGVDDTGMTVAMRGCDALIGHREHLGAIWLLLVYLLYSAKSLTRSVNYLTLAAVPAGRRWPRNPGRLARNDYRGGFRMSIRWLVVGAVASVVTAGAWAQKPYTTWNTYGGGGHSSQYSALNQINKSNVAKLEVAWSFPVGERSYVFNPIVVDRVMYVLARDNEIVALDAATGRELWARPHEGAVSARGINYWQNANGSDRRLLYLNAGMLTAIDARTGNIIESFGKQGRVDLRDGLARDGWDVTNVRPLHTSNPGRVIGNLMVVSLPAQGAGYQSTPGDVQAYDVVTGKLVWVFHSVPHEGEFGYDTWPKSGHSTAGGVHNWSELTVDEENGIVFVPFGTARYDFFGGNREGNNLYANSLVALDARTGKRLWHQQLVHHDLWDYDLPQAPKLLTIRDGRRMRQVVAQGTKHGFLFVFDRKSGEPVWPIEERRVPQSDVPGEHTSPTQPFPTKPAPFARQTFTEADINPYLADAEKEVLRQKLR